MGSQKAVGRRGAAGDRLIGSNAVVGQFEKYMREITPVYAHDARERHTPARSHDRERQFRVQDREAMYFFSESHMR